MKVLNLSGSPFIVVDVLNIPKFTIRTSVDENDFIEIPTEIRGLVTSRISRQKNPIEWKISYDDYPEYKMFYRFLLRDEFLIGDFSESAYGVGSNMSNTDTVQTRDRLHDGNQFSWVQQNLKYHELVTSVAPPTGKASFERKGFGNTAIDLIYNISNGSGQPIITMYGNRDVDVQGNLYSMGGGNLPSNQSIGKNAFIANVSAVNMLVDGVNAGKSITSGSNSVIQGASSLELATNVVVSVFNGAQSGQNIIGTVNGATGVGSAVFRNATSIIRSTVVGSSSAQTAGASFTDIAGLGSSVFQATNASISDAVAVGSGSQAVVVVSGNTSGGRRSLGLNTIGVNNAVWGTLAASQQTTASNVNILACNAPNTGNFSNIILMGNGATATADRQIVFGSVGNPIARVVTQSITPTITVEFNINGTVYELVGRPKPL